MPQPKTPLKPGQTYHIYTHGNGDENIFRCDENYHFFLRKYGEYIPSVAETFAYCLLPNHLHLMIRIQSEETIIEFLRTNKPAIKIDTPDQLYSQLSLQFSHLFNSYAQAYNRKYNRKGSLFISNFGRKPIDTQEYFVKLMAYIHLNPVHHGIVGDLNDWHHSSWHSYFSPKNSKLNRDEAFGWFGNKRLFIQTHKELRHQDIWKEFDL